MERGLALSGICGVMCLVAGLALAAEHTFDGTYSGKRVLTKGAASPACPAEEDVSVTVHGETLRFANGVLRALLKLFIPLPTDRSARLILMREVPSCIIMVV
jgi:hypothetical protein